MPGGTYFGPVGAEVLIAVWQKALPAHEAKEAQAPKDEPETS